MTFQSRLKEILDHTVYKEGNGPNGSGGEWFYSYISKDKDQRYSQIEKVPLYEALTLAFKEEVEQTSTIMTDDQLNKVETLIGYLQPLYDGLERKSGWQHFLPDVIEEAEEWAKEERARLNKTIEEK